MRSIELPDDLYADLESEAAKAGIRPSDLAGQLVQKGLDANKIFGHKRPPPVAVFGWTPPSSNAEINEILERDDYENIIRVMEQVDRPS